MNIGIVIVIHSVVILIGIVIMLYIFELRNRVINLEMSVAELLGDSAKLKKVSVGNYLDITRIKKRVGMDVEEKDLEGDKSEES